MTMTDEYYERRILKHRFPELPLSCSQETLGIFGYGNLGKRIESMATALGMRVMVAERKGQPPRDGRVTFEDVLREATVLVIAAPKNRDTIDMISEDELRMMRGNAILINVAHGGIVNEKDLVKVLRNGWIGGAAVDVYDGEPPQRGASPRLEDDVPNLILSPQLAWLSAQTISNLQDGIIKGLTAFKGNPLAVVKIEGEALPYEHMRTITREFKYSETVFLRKGQDGQLSMEIFTPADDLEFAGHPVTGTGYVLFHQLLPGISLPDPLPETISVSIKAGTVLLRYIPESDTVLAEVPHNVHVHSHGTPKQNIPDTQTNLDDQASRLSQDYPALVDMSDQEDLFARVCAGKCQDTPLDDGWAPSHTGTMYYRRQDLSNEKGTTVESLRVRMIAIDLEDSATGSACCSLAAYLALMRGGANSSHRFYMNQGREMGRESDIIVDVVLDESGKAVSCMFLSGLATLVAEGTIRLP
ncbi:hypothetical protein CEP53_003793 [Fusarium sp. AF-6]|nr:hypothetical protein CEP53_003793 [Fusarium sp. AF-6]